MTYVLVRTRAYVDYRSRAKQHAHLPGQWNATPRKLRSIYRGQALRKTKTTPGELFGLAGVKIAIAPGTGAAAVAMMAEQLQAKVSEFGSGLFLFEQLPSPVGRVRHRILVL